MFLLKCFGLKHTRCPKAHVLRREKILEVPTDVLALKKLGCHNKMELETKATHALNGEEDTGDRERKDLVLGLAKTVANSTAALVLKAKNVASNITLKVYMSK